MDLSYKDVFTIINENNPIGSISKEQNEVEKTSGENYRDFSGEQYKVILKKLTNIKTPDSDGPPLLDSGGNEGQKDSSKSVSLSPSNKYYQFITDQLNPLLKQLSPTQCYQLMLLFFKSKFYGTKEELKTLFDNPQHQKEFALLLSQFYNCEHTFKLVCVRDMLISLIKIRDFENGEKCSSLQWKRFKDHFRGTHFKQCIDLLKESYRSISERTDTDSLQGLRFLNREMNDLIVLLQIMILDLNNGCDDYLDFKQFVDLFEVLSNIVLELQSVLVQSHEAFIHLYEHLTMLTSLLCINCLNMNRLNDLIIQTNISKTDSQHICLLNQAHKLYPTFSTLLLKACPVLPLVGLAWVSTMNALKSTNEVVTKIGEQALVKSAFDVLSKYLNNPSFISLYGECILECFNIAMFQLLRSLLSQFEAENLCPDFRVFLHLLSSFLKSPQNSVTFFADVEKSSESRIGFSSLFIATVTDFPDSATLLFDILADSCHGIQEAVKIYNIVAGLNVTAPNSYNDANLSLQSSAVYEDSLNFDCTASGLVINGWLYCKSSVMKFLLAKPTDKTFATELKLVHSVTKLVHSLLKQGLSLFPSILQLLELFPQLVKKVCKAINLNMMASDVVKFSLLSMEPLIKLKPKLVLEELILSGIFPDLRNQDENLFGCFASECLFISKIFPESIKCGSVEPVLAGLKLLEMGKKYIHLKVGQDCCLTLLNLITRCIVPDMSKKLMFQSLPTITILERSISILVEIFECPQLANDDEYTAVLKSQLSQICLYSGFASDLIEIIEIGNEKLSVFLQNQIIFASTKGPGTKYKDLVKMTIKLILEAWNHNTLEERTVIEYKLFHENVGVGFKQVVSYIFQQLDSELPVVTCMFLQILASTPNSFFSFLDNLKESVRDRFARLLTKESGSSLLKCAVIKVMINCIDTQTAFIDFLFNFDATSKKVENPSALLPVINLVTQFSAAAKSQCWDKESSESGTVEKTAAASVFEMISQEYELALKLIHVIWTDSQSRLQDFIRNTSTFWTKFTTVLFMEKDCVYDNLCLTISSACSVMKTLAIQINTWGLNGGDLKSLMVKLFVENYFINWVEVVTSLTKEIIDLSFPTAPPNRDLSKDVAKTAADISMMQELLCSLLSAIRQLFTVLVNKNEGLKLIKQMDRDSLESVLDMCLLCLKNLLDMGQNSTTDSCISLMSLIVLNLVHNFEIVATDKLDPFCEILQKASKIETYRTFVKFHLSICSCLTLIMQDESSLTIDRNPNIELMIASVNNIVKLFLPQSECYQSLMQMKDLVATSDVTVSMLSILFLKSSSAEFYLTQLANSDIIPSLLLLFSHKIQYEGNSSKFAFTILSYFIQLATYKSSALFLLHCNVHNSICLALQSQQSSNQGMRHSARDETMTESNSGVTASINCFSSFMILSAKMLSRLEGSYIEQSCDVISCFENRIIASFLGVYTNQSEYLLEELLCTLHFIQEFSAYVRIWRLKLKQNFESITKSMASACQTCIALLIRPKYFQYLLKHGSHPSDRKRLSTSESIDSVGRGGTVGRSSTGLSGAGSSASMSRQRSLSSTLLTTGTSFSLEDAHLSGDELIEKQRKLLEIVTFILTSFNQMSLPITQACLITACSPDLTQYPILLDPSFSTPSIEANSVPCLGMLLSCCNYAVGLLIARTTDTAKSPRRVAESPGSSRQLMPRQCIFMMLEKAVLLLISQSSLIIQSSYNTPVDQTILDASRQSFIRDVSGELETFVTSIERYFHKTGISIATPFFQQAEQPSSSHSPGKNVLFSSDTSFLSSTKVDAASNSANNVMNTPVTSGSVNRSAVSAGVNLCGDIELTVYHIVEMFLNRCLKSSL